MQQARSRRWLTELRSECKRVQARLTAACHPPPLLHFSPSSAPQKKAEHKGKKVEYHEDHFADADVDSQTQQQTAAAAVERSSIPLAHHLLPFIAHGRCSRWRSSPAAPDSDAASVQPIALRWLALPSSHRR